MICKCYTRMNAWPVNEFLYGKYVGKNLHVRRETTEVRRKTLNAHILLLASRV